MRTPTFVTSRLRVRPLMREDLDAFHAIWGDPEVIFWGAMPDMETSRNRLESLLAHRLPHHGASGWFAVEWCSTGHMVGTLVLGPASWDTTLAEVGWHVGRRHQGRGFATEAVQGLLDHAGSIGVDTVHAKILPDNAPSLAVALRVGMRVIGHIEHPYGRHELWSRTLGTTACRRRTPR